MSETTLLRCPSRVLFAALAGALLAPTLLAQTPTPTVTPTPTPTATATPTPTPTTTATPTPTPTGIVFPASTANFGVPNGGRYDSANVVIDPAGAVWTASGIENTLVRLSADGSKFTRWTFPTDAAPSSLLREPDGTFWITELGGFNIAHFDPATGGLTEWADAGRRPTTLVKKADGKLWMTETGGALLEFDAATGTLTYHTANAAIASLAYPWLDADGTIWSGDFLSGALLRFNPDATKVTRWVLPNRFAYPSKILRAPNGKLWISLFSAGQLASFDAATGAFTAYDLTVASLPFDLKAYKGLVLYSEERYGEIGALDPASAVPTSVTTLTGTDYDTAKTVRTVVPKTQTLTSKDDAPSVQPAVGVSGTAFKGLAVASASTNTIWGFEVDLTRQRIFFSTAGNVGTLRPPLPVGNNDWHVPSAASVAGAGGTRWTTQTVSWNKGTPDAQNATKPIALTERLLPSDLIFGRAPAAAKSIGAGQLLVQPDPIGTDLGAPDSFGALRFVPDGTTGIAADYFAWARVQTVRADGGSYGCAQNGVLNDRAVKANETGFVFAPPETAGQRVNAGLLVLEDAKGTISVVNAAGATLGSFAFDWPSGYQRQLSGIFAALGATPAPSARIAFSLTSGKVLPFGTSIHTGTNDPVCLDTFIPADASGFQWISGVRRDTTLRTDLQLYNPGTADARISFDLSVAAPFGTPTAPRFFGSATVPAGKVVTLTDILATLGLTSGSGTLFVGSDVPVHAFARVTGGPEGAHYGYGANGVTGAELVGPANRGVFLAATDNGYFNTESTLYLFNSGDAAANVSLRAFFVDGTAAGTRDVIVPPKSTRSLQAAFYSISGSGVDFGRLEVLPATGSVPVAAVMIREDKKTGDADRLRPFVVAR